MSGFSIGLNALQANSSAIEVASKNIAASNVSGYKASEYLFQEALTRSLQPSSSGRFGSVGTGGISRRSYASGSTKYSSSPLDMSINGDGFFTVGLFKEPSAEKTFYTRSGQFLTDKDGYVVSSSGLFLYGFQPNNDKSDVTDKIGPLKEPASPMDPNPTSLASVSANLDARDKVVQAKIPGVGGALKDNVLDVNFPDTYSVVQQFPLYDKLGRQHAVSLYYRRVDEKLYDVYINVDGQIFAPNPADASGKLTVQMPSASVTPSTPPVPKPAATFSFYEGKLVNVGAPTLTPPTNGTKANTVLTIELKAPTGDPVDSTLLLSDDITFKLDFGGTTNYASNFEVKNVTQDGFASGSLTGLTVDDKGILRGQFTNGKTVVAGQLQMATFRGLGGLREVSSNVYQSTNQSGDPIFGEPAGGVFGSIRSNSVEEANTDMAGELVRLMVQQRNYQANAQSIRTQVEILSVTIDVTR